jgi:hypothetical protein
LDRDPKDRHAEGGAVERKLRALAERGTDTAPMKVESMVVGWLPDGEAVCAALVWKPMRETPTFHVLAYDGSL